MSKYPNKVDHLILLAGYTKTKIDKASTLLIEESNDEILNKVKFEDSLSDYKAYKLVEISGVNHEGFGWYSNQKGDGITSISNLEQQDNIIDKIILYLNP